MFLSLEDVDIEDVLEVWNDGFSDYSIPLEMNKEDLINRIETLDLSVKDSVLYVEDEKYKGIILLGSEIFKGKKQTWIGGMAVRKEFRNKGVAIKLLEYAENYAEKIESEEIILEVITNNIKAKNLYEKKGFKILNVLGFGEVFGNGRNYDRSKYFIKDIKIDDIAQLEDDKTPWQTRFATGGNVKAIYEDNEFKGYMFYEYISNGDISKIFIKQISLEEPLLINPILVDLTNEFKTSGVQIFNMDLENPVIEKLVEIGLLIKLAQYQMVKVI